VRSSIALVTTRSCRRRLTHSERRPFVGGPERSGKKHLPVTVGRMDVSDRRTRRRFLGGLAAAALAGCLSSNDGLGVGPDRADATTGADPTEGDATDAPTASPGPTSQAVPTPAPGTCPSEPQLPETAVDSEELPSVPEPPASLDGAAVRRYVEAFEYAYKYRAMAGYGDGIVEFNLDTSVEVAERGTDWVVVAADYARDYGRWDDGGGTPHGHFDGHRYAFGYLVTTEGVWRASHRETGSPPDPRVEGDLLVCF
jgi:hypothetical protein